MSPDSIPIPDLLDQYDAGPAAFARAVAAVPAELLHRKPGPGKWSVLEMAAHLADTEIVHSERIRRTLAEEEPQILAFDQDQWAASLGAVAEPDLDVALDAMAALRRSTSRLLRAAPAAAFARKARHSEAGVITLRSIVEQAARHPFLHVAQVARTLAALRGRRAVLPAQ